MCCFEGDPLGNVLRTQDTVTGQYECFSYDARQVEGCLKYECRQRNRQLNFDLMSYYLH